MAVGLPGKPRSRQLRRSFFYALVQQLRVVWPIFSGILLAMAGCGLIIGRIENWRVDEALYFTFVTGLTIGYGDFSPQHLLTRLLAIAIGFAGIVMTGLIAAVAVQALRAADRNLLNEAGNGPLDQRDP
ncbi:potassium channel family protein [Mesorhizobium sp.]|uniref:potassium channel family protein n=1 Tax=Mesorhizobium sp. TaxID=1871066 RepID=UPI0025798990|nr:potassium channel family protein [Mesorhizobium sp.]